MANRISNKNVICKSCGWVHFEASLSYVKKWEREWHAYYDKLKPCDKKHYGNKRATIETTYLNCQFCGGSHKNFRRALKKEIPFGSTIGPILGKEYDFKRPKSHKK